MNSTVEMTSRIKRPRYNLPFLRVCWMTLSRTSFAKWTASSLARPFPLFSFIVAIPIQEKEREDCQSIDKLNMNEQVIAQESKELTSTSTELVS